jgi:hypothetical protein
MEGSLEDPPSRNTPRLGYNEVSKNLEEEKCRRIQSREPQLEAVARS